MAADGFVDGFLEGVIEVPDHGYPFTLAPGNFVKLLLHRGGKSEVHDVGEVLVEEGIDAEAQLRWVDPALLLVDVFTVLDR